MEILKYFLEIGTITGGIIYLAKKMFEKWVDSKTLEYQYELDKKIEEFRIEKEQISEQNKVRFSRLHEERLIVIKELYKQIVEVNSILDVYIKKGIEFSNACSTYPESKICEEQEFVTSIITDYISYSEKNIIYFQEEFANELLKFNDLVYSMMMIISYTIKNKLEFTSDDNIVIENFRRNMPLIKRGLEKRFREILG